MSSSCFVIMPIRTPGSEEFEHFASIYQQISDVTESLGYDTLRADDVDRSGSITRDIVLRLSDSDLVVADLSDLNPNVFYELGVRHVLRKTGTVLLLDELRTSAVPFDLSSYRVVKYRGRLEGLADMRHSLRASIEGSTGEPAGPDNPVHDWIPSLPPDVAALADGSEEGRLRATIADLRATVADYQKRFGLDEEHSAAASRRNPLSVVQTLLRDAEAGNLPSDLFERAKAASDAKAAHEFLSAVSLLMQTGARLSERQVLELAQFAQSLGLEEAQLAVLEFGLELIPKSSAIMAARIARLLHSTIPAVRASARRESAEMLGIDEATERLPESVIKSRQRLQRVGPLLDSYHEDDLHDEALRLTSIWLEQSPTSSILLRNHGRAMERCGDREVGLELLRQATMAGDSDDTSVLWFANSLHNSGRHVDAFELYHLQALIDINDGLGFAHLADELSIAIVDPFMMGHDVVPRPLPAGIKVSVQNWVQAALSCPLVGTEVLWRCEAALKRMDLGFSGQTPSMPRTERLNLLRLSYPQLASDLTRGAPALRRFDVQAPVSSLPHPTET